MVMVEEGVAGGWGLDGGGPWDGGGGRWHGVIGRGEEEEWAAAAARVRPVCPGKVGFSI